MTNVFLSVIRARAFLIIPFVVARALAIVYFYALNNGINHFFVGIEAPSRLDKKLHTIKVALNERLYR